MNNNGFALVEILIALTILSVVLLSVVSAVSSGIYVMSGNRNFTKAMIIARSQMNEFILGKMRGLDLKDEQLEDYDKFTCTRVTEKFEHSMFGPMAAKKTDITIKWDEKENERFYKVSYIFPE